MNPAHKIHCKNSDEIAKMRVAGKLAGQVLEMIGDHIKPGISTATLNDLCHRYITDTLDAIPSTYHHQGFPASICTSVNHVVCHGIPSPHKILQSGDILNIDVTVNKDGFIGDTSKMFLVGKIKPHAKRLVDITQECLYLAIHTVKPGATLGDIGHVIESHATKNRFSVVREFGGHGIGQNMWEAPHVHHYGKPNTGLVLKPGMTFTIEPMLNFGKPDIRILADGWTVVTQDRSLSAQWEHTLLVTETGVDILTLRAEEQGPLHYNNSSINALLS